MSDESRGPRRRATADDIDDEVAHHLEMRARELMERGWDEESAHAEARRRFGDVDAVKRAVAREHDVADRRSRLSRWLEETATDLAVGLRRLVRSPGFTAVAVLTLALGIGANTALFSVLHAVVLQPLPFAEPDRLVQVWESEPGRGWDYFAVSSPNFVDYRAATRGLEELAAIGLDSFNLTGEGRAERLDAYRLSANFLSTLGVEPLHGRGITGQEDAPGSPARVVMLGSDLWQRRFDGDPDVVGRSLVLDDAEFVVVGVLPSLEPLVVDDAVFAPLAADADGNRNHHWLDVFGRLAEGTTPEAAEADLDRIAARLAERHPQSNEGFDTRVMPLFESVVPEETRSALYVLLGAVGLVLLIACANLSNLMLARATDRGHELAICGALGAGRGRIVRQLVAESVLVAAAGGGLAILLAYRVTAAVRGLDGVRISRIDQVQVDGPVLLFTLAIALLAGVVSGALPALQVTGGRLSALLAGGGRGGGGSGRTARTRRHLMAAEVALSVVLLAGAALLLRSLWLAQSVDPGIEVDRILTAEIGVPIESEENLRPVAAKYREILEAIRGVPGVETAAAISGLPFGGGSTVMDFLVEGRERDPDAGIPSAQWRLVSPGYFETAGIDLLRGRTFVDGDDLDGPHVAIISRRMAERHWPDEDPVGRRLLGWRDRPMRIVGVVEDVRERNLETEATNLVYLPFYKNPWWADMFLVLRAQGDPAALAPDLRSAVARVDPSLPVSFVRPMTEVVADTLGARRLNAALLGAFAGVALLLACAGIYGVISYGVARRKGEIGVRMALGARASQVVGLVVRQGMTAVLAGVALGLVGAFAVTRLLASQLYGITAGDPLSLATAVLFLTLTALLACVVPATRAARIDPMQSLRDS